MKYGPSLFLILVASWCLGLGANAADLRILLTNDDGYKSGGLAVLRKALLAAGFEVTTVAPLTGQSGASGKVTSKGELAVVEQESDVWSVDGAPADCVSVALAHVLKSDPPDLVISGPNFGQNLGGDTNFSGTVGAATMAVRLGYPAVAVSVGIDGKERGAKPVSYPSTRSAFLPASKLVVEMVEQLEKTRVPRAPFLPAGLYLNVNYPPVGKAAPKGVKAAPVSFYRSFELGYEAGDEPGALVPKLVSKAQPVRASERGTDRDYFARGFVTVSVLDGNMGVSKGGKNWLDERLSLKDLKVGP